MCFFENLTDIRAPTSPGGERGAPKPSALVCSAIDIPSRDVGRPSVPCRGGFSPGRPLTHRRTRLAELVRTCRLPQQRRASYRNYAQKSRACKFEWGPRSMTQRCGALARPPKDFGERQHRGALTCWQRAGVLGGGQKASCRPGDRAGRRRAGEERRRPPSPAEMPVWKLEPRPSCEGSST